MNTKYIHKFLFAISLVLFVVGGAYAATKDGDLGKLHARNGIKCADCHGKAKKREPVSMEKCVSCHGETEKLAKKTAAAKPRNPHESGHYGTEADCNLCHHQHKKSVNFCLPCHQRFDFVVP